MKNKILILFILYFISNVFMLINFYGVYWDDWTILTNFPEVWKRIFYETQTWPISNPIVSFFYDIGNGVFPYRIFTFFCFFIINILFYEVLIRLTKDNNFALLVALISCTLPINPARSLIICSFYTTAILLYFFYIFLYTKQKQSLVVKSISYIALSLSFVNNAILFIHFAFLCCLFSIQNKSIEIKSIKSFFKMHIFSLLLPIFYFLIKIIYLRPYGAYEEYNKITVLKLFNGIPLALNSILLSIKNNFLTIEVNIVLFIIILFVTNTLIKKFNFQLSKINRKHFLIGAIILFAGFYPFAVVEKLPYKYFVDSRFEFLSFIGFSILITSCLLYWSERNAGKKFNNLILSIIVSAFLYKNINHYSNQLIYWYQNEAIALSFKESDIVKSHSSFLIKLDLYDSTTSRMSRNFYTISGISKTIFGTSSKLYSFQNKILDSPFPNGSVPKVYKEREHYNLSQYNNAPFQYKLHIIQNKDISVSTVLEYLISKLTGYKSVENTKKLNKNFYYFEEKL